MPAMTPTQIKTFARLVTLTTAAATTVRSAVAAAAVFAEAMRAGPERPFKLGVAIGFLENSLDDTSVELLEAVSDLARIRQILDLPPAEASDDAEAAYMPATEAAELCAS